LNQSGHISERAVYVLTGGFTLASFIFFAFVPLPRAYYPELLFHRPEEFVPALFFLMALYGYLAKGAWRRDEFEHWLVLSLIVGLVSQTAFMSFSGTLFDLEFDAAHTLKKISYVCVLTGLLISMYAIFRREAESVNSLEMEIAARLRAEGHLKRKVDELARSNEELEQFASIAAHDLQEPLRKVQAFSDRLQDKYADVLDDRGKDYLNRMQNSASRMQTLIGDLLSFSRVTTKGQPFAPVDLNQIARGVVSDLEIRIQETKAKIEFSDMPTIDADPSQMRQLLQNLIGNALKYCRDNIAPLVKVDVQILDATSGPAGGIPERMCKITVADNGIGFEEEYAERIFGIFQRLHGRDKYDGAGVGLAICRKISERHGGSIVGKGRPNEGAEFVVTLPLRHAQT
jgi:signal transduction histidine kinase